MGLPAIVVNHEKTKEQLRDLGIGDYPPGLIEIDPYEDIVPIVNAHINTPLYQRMLIRHWMERSYSPARLVNRYWDHFFDELLEKQ